MKASEGTQQVTKHVPVVNVVMEWTEAQALLRALAKRGLHSLSDEEYALCKKLSEIVG